MVGATRLITGASDAAPGGDVRFPGEFSIMTGAYALGQVLCFGSLVYIIGYHGELHLLHRVAPVGSEPLASPPPLGPSRADLEVRVQQIRHSLVQDPTMSNRRWMFYMLANIHHQVTSL